MRPPAPHVGAARHISTAAVHGRSGDLRPLVRLVHPVGQSVRRVHHGARNLGPHGGGLRIVRDFRRMTLGVA